MRYGLKRRGITDKAKRKLVKAFAQEQEAATVEGRDYTPEAKQSFFRRWSDDLEVPVDVIRRHCEPAWTKEQTDFYTDKYLDLAKDSRVREKKVREWAKQTGVTFEYAADQVGHKPAAPRRRKKEPPAEVPHEADEAA